jgi:hypothetical protein
MLTKEQYEQLWEDWFKKPLKGVTMPCYDDYVKFEHMWEAVVSMFKEEKQLIRYILVAEARPFAECGSEKAEYVYDVSKKQTPFLTRVFNATYGGLSATACARHTSSSMVLDLIGRGVLVIDMFPFALKYETDMRKRMCANGNIRAAWDGHGAPTAYPKNISQKIKDLNVGGLLHRDWDLALIAPPIVSCCILSNGAAYPAINIPGNPGRHSSEFGNRRLHIKRCTCASEMTKVAMDTGQILPNKDLITEAFK